MENGICMFENPMFKKNEELKRGDIISTEYGNYGNWVQIVVDYVELPNKNNEKFAKLVGHYLKNNKDVVAYLANYERNKVVGYIKKAVPIKRIS